MALMSLMAIGAGMTGCSNEDMLEEPTVTGNKLVLEAYLDHTETKAPVSSWSNGNSMGLFVKSSGLSGSDYGEVVGQVKATINNNIWALSPEVSLSSAPASVYAYFPHDPTVTDGTAVPVEIVSQTDYLYSGYAVSASANNAKIALNMKHVFCVFAFNVKSNGYIGDGKLTSIGMQNKVGGKLFASKGTMDISTGVITKTSFDKYTITSDKQITSSGWTEAHPYAMVMPFQTASSSQVEFLFTVDGKTYTVDAPANMNYKGGEQYLFNLTINSSSMELDATNITIVPWGDQTGVDLEDVVTKVAGITYTMTTITANANHVIADLGSINGVVDWGDNSAEESYGTSKSHNYTAAGTYNIQVQAEDIVNTVNIKTVENIDEIDLSQLI